MYGVVFSFLFEIVTFLKANTILQAMGVAGSHCQCPLETTLVSLPTRALTFLLR